MSIGIGAFCGVLILSGNCQIIASLGQQEQIFGLVCQKFSWKQSGKNHLTVNRFFLKFFKIEKTSLQASKLR